MSVLSDKQILFNCSDNEESSVIYPYVEHPVRYVNIETGEPLPESEQYIDHSDDKRVRRVLSYGPTSYGYDVRLAGNVNDLKLIGYVNNPLMDLDPKRVKNDHLISISVHSDEDGARYVLIPPATCLLGPTLEYFRIPRDTIVIVTGKSTYARAGLIVNVTPIEPEFEGSVVMEVINPTSSWIRCYLDEGIAQFVFHGHNDPCMRSYKDKGGKYQGQTGLTLGKV